MDKKNISRRDFIKTTSTVTLAAMLAGSGRAFAAGSDTIRIGMIGCGGRGTGAMIDCFNSSEGIELVAMGDVFADRLASSRKTISEHEEGKFVDKVKVTDETSFVGFDAYEKVLACDIDLVIHATPPHFRPVQLRAAIEAGKHVFMEKPAAVDPAGIRSIIASGELAKEKGLAIVAGTQRRHQAVYRDIIKHIHNGDIGEIVSGQCYWNMCDLKSLGIWQENQPTWSEMEFQIRNWYYFAWLGGDHICEQHVHNLDIINWAIGSHPIKCMGMGGREVRTVGNIFDHFAVEYEYPHGVRVMSMCRQIDGCSDINAERVVGTKGSVYLNGHDGKIEGQNAYTYEGEKPNPLEVEHADLIESIRSGKPLNEAKRIAESTMTAIIGRMSAYTGRAMKWDWAMNASKLDYTLDKYELGDMPVEPPAIPGVTPLV